MNPIKRWSIKASRLVRLLGLFLSDRDSFRVVRRVRKEKLTYLDASALIDLHDSILRLEQFQQEGIIIEAGCALGGSAMVIAAAKHPSRAFYVYDIFGMIPPPSTRDGPDAHNRFAMISTSKSDGVRGDEYYGYRDDLFDQVKQTFSDFGYPAKEHNIHLVKGLFEDSLVVSEPVALAHLDCDWYDSVMICLQQIEPNLVPGGVLIIDDYQVWSGCRTAVDDYFEGRRDEFDFVLRSRLHIIRRRPRSQRHPGPVQVRSDVEQQVK